MPPLEDVHTVTRILERQFPQLAPVRARWAGAGMDNTAFEVNDEWIFRFPMRREVEATLAVERALLPEIAPLVELAIPVIELDGVPDEDFEFRFAGYRKIPGVPATQVDQSLIDFDAIAWRLADLLSALHQFPVADAERLGAQTTRLELYFEHMRERSIELLPTVHRIAPELDVAWLHDYLRALAPLPLAPWPLTLTHHDLAAEHVLMEPDGSLVTGVIDWGDVGIVDPSVDFVGLHAWHGDDFVRAVLSHYDGPVDERVLERVRPWSTFRVIEDIEFGIKQDIPEVVRMAVESLQLQQKL